MQKRIPHKFYKYLPKRLDRIEDILVHNRVFFSSPVKFNDPFDCARGVRFPDPDNLSEKDVTDWQEYFLHLTQDEQNEHNPATFIRRVDPIFFNGKHKDKDFIKQCERSIERAIREYAGGLCVFCLSETPSSVSMWAHYASNHEGLVIEFDRSKLIDDAGNIRSFPVLYKNTLPTLNEYLNAARSRDSADFPKLFFCRKSSEWKREREWRFFTEASGHRYITLPAGTVTRVIFGYKMATETRNTVTRWVRRSEAPIQLAESLPSIDKFEMIPVNLRYRPIDREGCPNL